MEILGFIIIIEKKKEEKKIRLRLIRPSVKSHPIREQCLQGVLEVRPTSRRVKGMLSDSSWADELNKTQKVQFAKTDTVFITPVGYFHKNYRNY